MHGLCRERLSKQDNAFTTLKSGTLQRKASKETQIYSAPPIVNDVLNSPGRPLDTGTRALYESYSGHDFGKVRIHADDRAAESTRALNALAYTVGRDVVVGDASSSPLTVPGNNVLAHELVHVIQQQTLSSASTSTIDIAGPNSPAEREAAALTDILHSNGPSQLPITIKNHPPGLYRLLPPIITPKPTATSTSPTADILTPSGTITRTKFDQFMQHRFGVSRIFTGTFQDQQIPGLTEGMWGHPWDPGPSSEIYSWIIEAFNNMAIQMGGLPPVDEIAFFYEEWELDKTVTPPLAKKNPITGGNFGAGRLNIFHSINRTSYLPIGLSKPGQIGVGGIKGASPGAIIGGGFGLGGAVEEESTVGAVTHELGHALAESTDPRNRRPGLPVPAPDPNMLDDYKREVGWTPGSSSILFDIGASAVQTAIANNTPPPSTLHITEDNWNDPRWKEQPISGYMVTAPPDDFAEAVKVYAARPDLLLERSPHRYRFLDKRKERWLPNLRRIPQVTDAPFPQTGSRLA